MRTAVLGAGIMGTGIAQVCAEAGLDVVLESRSLASLEAARERIRKNQRELVAAGLLGERDASAALARVRLSQDLGEAVCDADFVSENIPEDLGLKQAFFQEVSRLARPTTILSTNTSGLSITAIAAAVDRPERVVGFHWLNPPHLMLPVEVTRGEKTSDVQLFTAVALARRLGKTPVVVRDSPGFVVNRVLMPYLREAMHLLEEGYPLGAVELGLGLRWAAVGPFRIADLAGLPTFRAIAAYVYPELSSTAIPQTLLEDSIRRGHTGARAGRGFYAYPPGAHESLIGQRDARLIALRRLLARDAPPERTR